MYPVLYILMRTDLKSMNPGKAMAQAAHAANQFVKYYRNNEYFQPDLLEAWENQADGFGTTIVLGCTESQMRQTVETMAHLNWAAGITHDPTYPLLDGDTLHLIPLDTCGYIFCDKDDPAVSFVLKNLSLHP